MCAMFLVGGGDGGGGDGGVCVWWSGKVSGLCYGCDSCKVAKANKK